VCVWNELLYLFGFLMHSYTQYPFTLALNIHTHTNTHIHTGLRRRCRGFPSSGWLEHVRRARALMGV
jgi:hypothetical protein